MLRSFSLLLLFERFVRLLALLLIMLDPTHVSMRVLHVILLQAILRFLKVARLIVIVRVYYD